MNRFALPLIGLALCAGTLVRAQRAPQVVSYLEIYDVELEEASTSNILKGLRKSVEWLRKLGLM